jgi:exosortase/archaeosortase family protein
VREHFPGRAGRGGRVSSFATSPLVRFVARFSILLGVLGAAQLLRSDLAEPLQVAYASLLWMSLDGLGWPSVSLSDVVVSFPGTALGIGDECTGLALHGLLLAFVVAYPATARYRLAGFVLGSLIIAAANLLRLVSCAYLLRYWPSMFPFVHEYVWQIGLTALTFGIALCWSHAARPCHP